MTAIARLLSNWEARSRDAHPSDAMLINRHVRELREALATEDAHLVQNDGRVTELIEAAQAVIDGTVSATTYPDGPCIERCERERLRALEKNWRSLATDIRQAGGGGCSNAKATERERCADELATLIAELGQEVGAVAFRDDEFVLMPRRLTQRSLERMAYFDFDDVGNGRGDAAEELWGELIEIEHREIPALEFSNPVFHAGNNTTVRRGIKWHGADHARLSIGSESVIVSLSTMTQRFCYLTDHYLRDEHDPSCRTVAGLLAEMKRVYPGFSETEDVTLVNFTLPAYTSPAHTSEARDAARYRWLRQFDVDSYIANGSRERLDAAIDAAMRQEGGSDE